jgi:glycosyltransferase involved in cell wall biosynthesis
LKTSRRKVVQVCAVDFTAFHLLRPLLYACRDADFDTSFACADGEGARALRAEGFAYRAVPMSRGVSPRPHINAVARLTASLRHDPADLVHTHTPIGGMVGRAAAALARVPVVVHTFHGLAYADGKLGVGERTFLLAERLLVPSTDHFFSQAVGDAERAVRLGIADANRIEVIGNGIDLSRFHPDVAKREATRFALGIPPRAIVAITVARLIREKGILDLAAAAASLSGIPDLYFVVVGEALASDRDSIEKELDNHPVVGLMGGRWRRLGYRSDVDDLLRCADVFILPSYREGLPRSLIEAMACGVPAIASDIPAGRELVEDGVNGLLVRPHDVRALSSAIERLAQDANLRITMGEHARRFALDRHDESQVLDREIRAFNRLLGR